MHAGVPAAVVIVPLLFEVGAEREWDHVVCVGARKSVQMARLAARGLTAADAERRMRAQMSLSEKMVRSEFVIMNDGGREALREQTARTWRAMGEKEKRRQQ